MPKHLPASSFFHSFCHHRRFAVMWGSSGEQQELSSEPLQPLTCRVSPRAVPQCSHSSGTRMGSRFLYNRRETFTKCARGAGSKADWDWLQCQPRRGWAVLLLCAWLAQPWHSPWAHTHCLTLSTLLWFSSACTWPHQAHTEKFPPTKRAHFEWFKLGTKLLCLPDELSSRDKIAPSYFISMYFLNFFVFSFTAHFFLMKDEQQKHFPISFYKYFSNMGVYINNKGI